MTKSLTATKPNLLRAILLAGFIAGSLDILAAFVQIYLRTGKSPLGVLNYIASALFGKEQSGGTGMTLLGLLFHYLIAFAFTVFFFWLYPKWQALSKNKIITAIGYGLFVWAVMNLVIVPLSKIPGRPFDLSKAAVAALILICMIGLPVTLLAGKYYSKK